MSRSADKLESPALSGLQFPQVEEREADIRLNLLRSPFSVCIPQSACAWSQVPTDALAAWKSGTVDAGALCVMTDGTSEMQQWPVGSWDVGGRWPPLGVPDSDLVQDPCGWMTWGVEEESRLSGTVPGAPGAGATVTTLRMQGWSALVCGMGGGHRLPPLLFSSQVPAPPSPQEAVKGLASRLSLCTFSGEMRESDLKLRFSLPSFSIRGAMRLETRTKG